MEFEGSFINARIFVMLKALVRFSSAALESVVVSFNMSISFSDPSGNRQDVSRVIRDGAVTTGGFAVGLR
jgi:hypothetical protein